MTKSMMKMTMKMEEGAATKRGSAQAGSDKSGAAAAKQADSERQAQVADAAGSAGWTRVVVVKRSHGDAGVGARASKPHVCAEWSSASGRWQYGSCHPSGVASRRSACALCGGQHAAQWCVGDKCCFVCGGKLGAGGRSSVRSADRPWPNKRCASCVEGDNGGDAVHAGVVRREVKPTKTGSCCRRVTQVGSRFEVLLENSDDEREREVDVAVDACRAKDTAVVDDDCRSECSSCSSVSAGEALEALPSKACGDTAVSGVLPCAAAVASCSASAVAPAAVPWGAVVSTWCLRGDKLAASLTQEASARGGVDAEAAAQVVDSVLALCRTTGALRADSASWCHPLEFGSGLAVLAQRYGHGVVVMERVQAGTAQLADCDAAVETAFRQLRQQGVVDVKDVIGWCGLDSSKAALRTLRQWLDEVFGTVSKRTAVGVASEAPTTAQAALPPTPAAATTAAAAAAAAAAVVPSSAPVLVSAPTACVRSAVPGSRESAVPSGAVAPCIAPKDVAASLRHTRPVHDVPARLASWEDGGFCCALLRGVAALGYERPSATQASVMPAVMSGRDVIATAPSGTGKTLGYALPTLHALDVGTACCQVLVLVPTWELVHQVRGAVCL